MSEPLSPHTGVETSPEPLGDDDRIQRVQAEYSKRLLAIAQRQPGALEKSGYGRAAWRNYVMYGLVHNLDTVTVKAEYTRTAIEGFLAEGNRSEAVSFLEYADVAHLQSSEHDPAMPEITDQLISTWYNASMGEGNHHDAWRIAQDMKRDELHRKIIREDLETDLGRSLHESQMSAWNERERAALPLYAKDLLQANDLNPNDGNYLALQGLMNTMAYRKDSFALNSPNPDPLVGEIRDKAVAHAKKRGRDIDVKAYDEWSQPTPTANNSVVPRRRRFFGRT